MKHIEHIEYPERIKRIKYTGSILLCLVFGSFLACATTLTPGGKKVSYVTKAEAPRECQLIGEVEQGDYGFPIPSTAGELKVALRNKAAEIGGNYLVIDSMEAERIKDGGRIYYGSGRAYRC